MLKIIVPVLLTTSVTHAEPIEEQAGHRVAFFDDQAHIQAPAKY
jgi:hypothetical protein